MLRRLYYISDIFYRLKSELARRKLYIVFYCVSIIIGLIIGIRLGSSISDTSVYISCNGTIIFKYLTCRVPIFTYFIITLAIMLLCGIICTAFWFNRFIAFLTIAPIIYLSYLFGLVLFVLFSVYSGSVILFVLLCYIPITLAELFILCIMSFYCIYSAGNTFSYGISPTDIKYYYKGIVAAFIALFICSILRLILTAMTTTGLVGIV